MPNGSRLGVWNGGGRRPKCKCGECRVCKQREMSRRLREKNKALGRPTNTAANPKVYEKLPRYEWDRT